MATNSWPLEYPFGGVSFQRVLRWLLRIVVTAFTFTLGAYLAVVIHVAVFGPCGDGGRWVGPVEHPICAPSTPTLVVVALVGAASALLVWILTRRLTSS